MSFELWLSFSIATLALLAMPGPVVILLIGTTLGHGRSIAWAAIPGVVLGDFVAMTASLLGLGAILAASSTLFFVMKVAGAVYLVYLGIRIWRSELTSVSIGATDGVANRVEVCRQAFLVTALNPKDIVFFVAFLPQFIDASGPALSQVLIIEATFLSLVVLTTVVWITIGSGLRNHFTNPFALRRVNRFGGACLASAGALAVVSG